MAGVRRDRDFAAWQLADAFKQEVFRLVRHSVDASRDFKYRDQLRNAAAGITKHITEGYLRFSPLDFARFLDYAMGSIGEAERRLRDGVELGYFSESDSRDAFRFAKRCFVATLRLKQSQIRYAERLRLEKRRLPAPRSQRQKGRSRSARPRAKPDSDEPKRT
jgi:four helix bundle protein